MKKENILSIKCPCCSSDIRVDLDERKVIHHSSPNKKLSIEDMVKEVKSGKSKVLQRFEEEQDKFKGRKNALDKLFKDSVKKAIDGE